MTRLLLTTTLIAAVCLLVGCQEERYNSDVPSFASDSGGYQTPTNGISSPVSNRGYGAGTSNFTVGQSGYGFAQSRKQAPKTDDGWFDWW